MERPTIAGVIDIIGVEPEGKGREEAEAIMIAMVSITILSHPHSTHVVIREPAGGEIRSRRHHAATPGGAAVDGATAHVATHVTAHCAGR
jgi:hypothetical protein